MMKSNYYSTLILCILLLMNCRSWASAVTALPEEHQSGKIGLPGSYQSKSGKCPITIVVSAEGGFKQLLLESDLSKNEIVNDITSAIYFSNELLVFSTSPLYVNPGIFVYDCSLKNIKRIVAPQKPNKAYPQGADFFELKSIEDDTIYYYHTTDVDKTDFNILRTNKYLFQVFIDGSSLKKVRQ